MTPHKLKCQILPNLAVAGCDVARALQLPASQPDCLAQGEVHGQGIRYIAVEGCPQWVGAEKCLLGAVWVLGNMIPFWFILKVCGLLRATADEEALGLDSSHHVTTPSLHPVPPNDPNITRLCQSVSRPCTCLAQVLTSVPQALELLIEPGAASADATYFQPRTASADAAPFKPAGRLCICRPR